MADERLGEALPLFSILLGVDADGIGEYVALAENGLRRVSRGGGGDIPLIAGLATAVVCFEGRAEVSGTDNGLPAFFWLFNFREMRGTVSLPLVMVTSSDFMIGGTRGGFPNFFRSSAILGLKYV